MGERTQNYNRDRNQNHLLLSASTVFKKMGKNRGNKRKATAKVHEEGEASVPMETQSKKKASPLAPPPPGSFRTIQPPLSQGVLDFLDSKNFHTMTPVQEATIPLFLTNKDVAVQAVTGKSNVKLTLVIMLTLLQTNFCEKGPGKHWLF